MAILFENCAGTILDARHILTSATCLPTVSKVYVGGETMDSPNIKEVRVEKLIPHHWFKPDGFDYDYAIIRLAEKLQFSDFVKPLPLNPSVDTVPVDEEMWTYGWGSTSDPNDNEFALRKTNVLSGYYHDCKKAFNETVMPNPPEFTDRMMCSGGSKNSPCVGDRGGPLIYEGSQVGITSWTHMYQCGVPYMVYSRVGAVVKWIQRVLKGNE